MKVNVAPIKKVLGPKVSFEFVTTAKEFADSEFIWADGDIKVIGEAVNTGRELELSGTILVAAALKCDRCLEEYTASIEIPFAERYREDDTKEPLEQAGLSYYQGDEIHIDQVVLENIIMAEPLKRLCKEECRGLCPYCGINLNHAVCACNHQEVDPRLAVLQQLLKKQ
ncbi:MAG: DUF177 domain-containing protein [Pelosinus sp.]|nr:DUF177 domain-containing protein [Pelosinus sp.]